MACLGEVGHLEDQLPGGGGWFPTFLSIITCYSNIIGDWCCSGAAVAGNPLNSSTVVVATVSAAAGTSRSQ